MSVRTPLKVFSLLLLPLATVAHEAAALGDIMIVKKIYALNGENDYVLQPAVTPP